MTPEQQVTTQTTSQALADAGIEFDSYLVWHEFIQWGVCPRRDVNKFMPRKDSIVSAPTAQELLEKMPIGIKIANMMPLALIKQDGVYSAGYSSRHEFKHSNPAEALGLMCLWLHKEGHL